MTVTVGITQVHENFGVQYARNLAAAVIAALPVAVWALTRHADPLVWFSVVAAGLIFWRHRTNVSRLLDGTEARFARKPGKTAD